MRTSTAGTFWSRLNAIDFMNSSLQFAALAVLVLLPFLVVVSAESGGDARNALVVRLGLDQKAAQDVDQLMSSGRHEVTTLGIVGAAVVLFGAIGIASTLQVWYQRVYDQPPAQDLIRQLANRLLWLVGMVLYLVLQDFSFTRLKPVGGARIPPTLPPLSSRWLSTGGRPTSCCWAGLPGAGSSRWASQPPCA